MLKLGAHWEIYRHGECKDCSPFAGVRDGFAVRSWLQQFKGNPAYMDELRHMLSREGSIAWRADRATDDEIIEHAAHLLGTGQWHLHETGRSRTLAFTQSPTDSDAAGAKSKQQDDARNSADGRQSADGARSGTQKGSGLSSKELTWIEIQLVDAGGKPVAGMAYEIKMPDGSKQAGKLDVLGRARHEQIVPGQCEVRFPELDGGDWKPA